MRLRHRPHKHEAETPNEEHRRSSDVEVVASFPLMPAPMLPIDAIQERGLLVLQDAYVRYTIHVLVEKFSFILEKCSPVDGS